MSSKERITVTLDPENAEWLDAECNNRSAFINDLLEDYRTGGRDMENAVAAFRLRQLEAQKTSLESQVESVESEINAVSEAMTTPEDRRQEVVEDAVNELGIDPSVGYDHAAAENWAEKAGMDVESFWQAYTEEYNDE